jgi:FAD/FMN-containing dehydrogenase
MTMPRPFVDLERSRRWNNWHNTSGVGGSVERFYTPRNIWDDGAAPVRARGFEPGLAGLQQIVQEAELACKRVRAVGSGWSLSRAAFVEDFLVNTARLAWWSVGFSAPMVEPSFQDRRGRLVLAQCGVQIKVLNAFLEQRGLALPTAGASNGQTIVGAISTGTHGSAHDVGGMADFAVGLHVVAEGGRSHWIERASRPAMTAAFARWLGATVIRDDDLFLAAVVGLGSFGLVHAVVFEAVPLYLLELSVRQYDYAQVEAAALARSPASLGLPAGDESPYHFEVVINPYRRAAGQGGAFVRVLYHRPAMDPLPRPAIASGHTLRSNDLVSIASVFSDAIPASVPGLLQSELHDSLAPGEAAVLGTPGQHFGDSPPTGGGTSTEIGVPLDRLGDALAAIFSVTDQFVFGAPVALRYVRGSDALLAFTCFSPTTCAIEMPGIDSARTREGQARVWNELRSRGIPHTFHWGQALPGDRDWVVAGFGPQRVQRWLDARARLLVTTAGRRMFSNALLESSGLA